MLATMLLIAALAQCGPGGCPIQSSSGGYSVLPQSFAGADYSGLASESYIEPMPRPIRRAPFRTLSAPRQSMRYVTLREPPSPPPVPPAELTPYAEIEAQSGYDFVSHEQDVDWGWYFVNFDGMIFPVWGYHVDRRTVRWSPSLRANAAVLAHARLTR